MSVTKSKPAQSDELVSWQNIYLFFIPLTWVAPVQENEFGRILRF